jgi:hypothetical protein
VRDELLCRPSTAKTVLYLFGCLIFVAGAIGLLLSEGFSIPAALALAFFGFGSVFFGIVLLRPESAYLELRPDGFTVRRPFYGAFSHAWGEVSNFRVEQRRPTFWVRYVKFDQSDPQSTEELVKTTLTGTGELAMNYGMRWQDLAQLMNDWQRQYGGSPG